MLDIAIRFTRNLPTDLASLADVISKLQVVCSQETLLTLLPFVENPTVEIQKFKTEQASAELTDVAGAKEGETS